MRQLRTDFTSPSTAFRGAPFWSWNDRLQIEELTRQVRDMRAHGMGGFFMHSREGLETPYMGDKWLECIRETVRVAGETGMHAWLYDEDRWPSGFAGGLVPARGGDAFRAKGLVMEQLAQIPSEGEPPLALFAARLEGETLLDLRRLSADGESLAPGETCLAFRRKVAAASEWFNDDAYADNLNPESVAAFIDITYETYRQNVGEEFGKAIPGIFTDEPNIQSHRTEFGGRALPWTDGLLDFFRERRGYDLLDVLPWLFFDGQGAARARHDYWYTVSQRFTEAFTRQIGAWCAEHGLDFTGHFLNEAEMGQGILRGGAIMPHYRYQQVPGIDMLTEQNHEFITIKQCSSVANQMGRSRVLSETYGCSGWEFTFEGQKWNGDWQYVLGVNLRCQHLALYSLRGCRKRDYPPAFNYNTTWWKYNSVVEDYFARIGRVLSEGRAVRDVLLLHPVATGWSMLGEGDESTTRVDAFGERLNDFCQALLATHYDFDFGDEQILALDGSVDGASLMVGRAAYPLVVIPPETRTLLASTLALLERFLDAGGTLVVFSPAPEWIEARPDPDGRLASLWARPGVTVLGGVGELNTALERLLPRRISLLTRHGQQAARLLYMQRDLSEGQAFFIVNNDRQTGCAV
ncbi:MAG TPA: glycosyl hydrolase, partial [Anaerolinea sp.]|nr:glycosyl hydrolase [Anaerolinea sp.]